VSSLRALLTPDGLRRRVEAVTETGRSTWRTTFGLTLVVYLMTAHWRTGQVSDAMAASWPAYALRRHGSFFLDGLHPPTLFALGTAHGHHVAFRTPGVILSAVPAQLTVGWVGFKPEHGGALTAAVMSALAMANVALLLRGLVRRELVLPVTAITAFGTSVWTVAAAVLWTHGPDLLALSTALLLVQRGRHALAGWALSWAVLTRPHLAVVCAALGIGACLALRRVKPLLLYGGPAAVALGATVAWNAWYLGSPHLLAGAYTGQQARILGGPNADFSPSLLKNAAGFLVSPGVGLLLFSPVVLVGFLCLLPGWRRSPWWARAAALGGLAYALVQAKLNYFNGGGGFYGYRLLLEPLLLLLPLMALGYDAVRDEHPALRLGARATAAISCAIYGIGAQLAYYWFGGSFDWDVWYPWYVVRHAGLAAVLPTFVVTTVLAMVLGLMRPVRAPARASAAAAVPAAR
jgi:hypothetical protein